MHHFYAKEGFMEIPVEVVNKVKRSVVEIYARESCYSKPIKTGTGIIVSSQGYILTCAHVVCDIKTYKPYELVEVIFPETLAQGFARNYKIEVPHIDQSRDIALCELIERTPFDLPAIQRIQDYDDVCGCQPVRHIGNSVGRGIDHSSLEDVADPLYIHPFYKNKYLRCNGHSNSGDSGGPVINVDGKCIGIVARIPEDEVGKYYAIPISEVESFLKAKLPNVDWDKEQNYDSEITNVVNSPQQEQLLRGMKLLRKAMRARSESIEPSADDDKDIEDHVKDIERLVDEGTYAYSVAEICKCIVRNKANELNNHISQIVISSIDELYPVAYYIKKNLKQHSTVKAFKTLIHDLQVSQVISNEEFALFQKDIEMQWSIVEKQQDYPTLENYDHSEFEIEGTNLVRYIGNREHIDIPLGVTRVDEYAFFDCGFVASVTIGGDVIRIGDHAFDGCNGLEEVCFMDCNLQFIGDHAFKDCVNLMEIDLTNQRRLKFIGNYAFRDCSLIGSVTIPKLVTCIGQNAFSNLYKLYFNAMSCDYEDFAGAFIKSDNLALVIGKSVLSAPKSFVFKWVYVDVFTGKGDEEGLGNISHLNSITVEQGNERYHSCNNCLIETETKELVLGCKNSIIPDDGSVVEIGWQAFSRSEIDHVLIPNNVQVIQVNAFENSQLTSVVISNTVIKICEGAFANCRYLSEIVYWGTKDQWASIEKEEDCFSNIPIQLVQCTDGDTDLYISNSKEDSSLLQQEQPLVKEKVKHFETIDPYCKRALKFGLIYRYGKISISSIQNAFKISDERAELIISMLQQMEYIEEYSIGDSKSKSLNILITLADLNTVLPELQEDYSEQHDDYPTLENYDHEEFEIEGTKLIEYIGRGGEVKIPQGVTKICDESFEWSDATIFSLHLPASVMLIQDLPYENNIREITVDTNNPRYHSQNNCLIETAGKELVLGCVNSIIPDDGSVSVIGIDAFAECDFESITIPRAIEVIRSDAFYGCRKLNKIIYLGTKQQWQQIKKYKSFVICFINKVTIVCSDGELVLDSE